MSHGLALLFKRGRQSGLATQFPPDLRDDSAGRLGDTDGDHPDWFLQSVELTFQELGIHEVTVAVEKPLVDEVIVSHPVDKNGLLRTMRQAIAGTIA